MPISVCEDIIGSHTHIVLLVAAEDKLIHLIFLFLLHFVIEKYHHLCCTR
jgi:hypothetical protein